MENAEKVLSFIKEAGTYYFISMDGDKPRCRPFAFVSMRNGKVVFATGTQKNVYKQIVDNPKVEVVATVGMKFLRCDGEIEFFDDAEFEKKTFEENPYMGDLYNAHTGLKIAFFHLKSGHVEIVNAMDIEEEFDLE